MKLREESVFIPYEIELNFKDQNQLKKQFYRKAVKQMAEWLVNNAMILERESRNSWKNSIDGVFILKGKVFIKDSKDPSRLPS